MLYSNAGSWKVPSQDERRWDSDHEHSPGVRFVDGKGWWICPVHWNLLVNAYILKHKGTWSYSEKGLVKSLAGDGGICSLHCEVYLTEVLWADRHGAEGETAKINSELRARLLRRQQKHSQDTSLSRIDWMVWNSGSLRMHIAIKTLKIMLLMCDWALPVISLRVRQRTRFSHFLTLFETIQRWF